jgi:hypothetical protein
MERIYYCQKIQLPFVSLTLSSSSCVEGRHLPILAEGTAKSKEGGRELGFFNHDKDPHNSQ